MTQRTPGTDLSGFGWAWWLLVAIGSALSIVYLIDENGWITLGGLIKKWVDAWHFLVSSLTRLAFGWIDWKWMRIDKVEGHIIFLASVLASAIVRAATDEFLQRVILVPLLVAPFVALAALIPDPFGAIAPLCLLIGWAAWQLVPGSLRPPPRPILSPHLVLRELIATVGFVVFLVLVNHLWNHLPEKLTTLIQS